MTNILSFIGFAGTVLVAVAYLPQIVHLIKKRCSMGIDKDAWFLWVIASVMIFLHAISVKEPVFVTLVSINLILNVFVLTLGIKYENNICKDHLLKYGVV